MSGQQLSNHSAGRRALLDCSAPGCSRLGGRRWMAVSALIVLLLAGLSLSGCDLVVGPGQSAGSTANNNAGSSSSWSTAPEDSNTADNNSNSPSDTAPNSSSAPAHTTPLYYDPPDWERADSPNSVTMRATLQPGSNMPTLVIEVFSIKEVFGPDNATPGYQMKWLTVTTSPSGQKLLDVALDNNCLNPTDNLRFVDYNFDGFADLCVQQYNDYGLLAYSPDVDGDYRSYQLFGWDIASSQFVANPSFSQIPSPAADPASQTVYSHNMELVQDIQFDTYTTYAYQNGRFVQTDLLTVEIIPDAAAGTERLIYTEYDANGALPAVSFTRPARSSEIDAAAQQYYVVRSLWDLNSTKWLGTMDLGRVE